jgi:GT2 family glycosyltransferase
MAPQLSIVIPVYDNWWLTARCLQALDRLRNASVSFETIVVDNASSDETPHSIREFPWVRYVRHEQNLNFAGACNAGARLSEAPLVLLLNNDAYPLGDAFRPIVRAFDRDDVAIAGGALFFEDGVTQAAGLVLLRNLHWHYYYRNLPASLNAVHRSRDSVGVSGAAMAVCRDWFLESGGFDETFVNGFEDVDLCLRAREEGHAVIYVADARFAHYEAASAGRFAREAENERRFYERWSHRMTALPRTLRGDVGAIAVRCGTADPLLVAALADLEAALRAFGHPLVRDRVAPWRRMDRRFRRAATLSWFGSDGPAPGMVIDRRNAAAAIRTHGEAALDVPFLPCVDRQRAGRSGVARSDDPACARVGVVGGDLPGAVALTPEMLLGARAAGDFTCVVHIGLTDGAAFGNVLLAMAGLPAVALATPELRAIFADDVAFVCERDRIADSVALLVRDVAARRRYGALAAADAQRRFSPRRSAIRVVDLLCAARFGLERQATL